MTSAQHWDNLYEARLPTELTWYQSTPAVSLDLIRDAKADYKSKILDVGGGTSLLADHLVELGFLNVSVLDISSSALATGQRRLGPKASLVQWIERDVLEDEAPLNVDIWHDRAMFHFLTQETDQRSYIDRMTHSVSQGGHAIIAAFALDGPETCSGLPVQRYGPAELTDALDPGFVPVTFVREDHVSPTGFVQKFVYSLFERTSGVL